VYEVSRRVWGLRLRRTEQGLALSPLYMWPSAHFLLRQRPGCKFSQLNCPPRLYPCLRFTVSLAVTAQDSGPSGSLILSRKNFAFSASYRFIPAHKNRHYTHNHCPGVSQGEDIVLRSDIERKRLIVEAQAQRRDERERDYAEDRAAEEPSPLAASKCSSG
jgi:hypothetical protein